MKRQLKNVMCSVIDSGKGSAGAANKRGGKIKFGTNYVLELDNNWFIEFPTGVVRVDVNANKVDVYCNVFLRRQRDVVDSDGHVFNCMIEFIGCTAEEVEQILNFAKNASDKELIDRYATRNEWRDAYVGKDSELFDRI